MEYEGRNKSLTKFKMGHIAFEQLYPPWKKCLVVKLLGKSIGFLTMKEKLKLTWKLEGWFDLIDVSYVILWCDLTLMRIVKRLSVEDRG